MADKKSWVSIGKILSVAITVSVPITLGLMVVVDKHIENEISNIHRYADSMGVVVGPEDSVTVDALMAAPTIIFAPPNTLFVPSPPSTTIVIHRDTVFDTVRVETEKPKPPWHNDRRRAGRPSWAFSRM